MHPHRAMLFFQVYMESWLLKTLNEKLVALPFECALQTAQFVMTLGESRPVRPICREDVAELRVVLLCVQVPRGSVLRRCRRTLL